MSAKRSALHRTDSPSTPLGKKTGSVPLSGSSSATLTKQKFTSPYQKFCQEMRPHLPTDLRNAQRETLLGQQWKALSEPEKAKYAVGVVKYKSPFLVFCKEQRPLLQQDLRNAQRETLLGLKWKALTEAEKASYEETLGLLDKGPATATDKKRAPPRAPPRAPARAPARALAAASATASAAVLAAASAAVQVPAQALSPAVPTDVPRQQQGWTHPFLGYGHPAPTPAFAPVPGLSFPPASTARVPALPPTGMDGGRVLPPRSLAGPYVCQRTPLARTPLETAATPSASSIAELQVEIALLQAEQQKKQAQLASIAAASAASAAYAAASASIAAAPAREIDQACAPARALASPTPAVPPLPTPTPTMARNPSTVHDAATVALGGQRGSRRVGDERCWDQPRGLQLMGGTSRTSATPTAAPGATPPATPGPPGPLLPPIVPAVSAALLPPLAPAEACIGSAADPPSLAPSASAAFSPPVGTSLASIQLEQLLESALSHMTGEEAVDVLLDSE